MCYVKAEFADLIQTKFKIVTDRPKTTTKRTKQQLKNRDPEQTSVQPKENKKASESRTIVVDADWFDKWIKKQKQKVKKK